MINRNNDKESFELNFITIFTISGQISSFEHSDASMLEPLL